MCPDVYGERRGDRPLFIEVEDSTGAKFQTDGPRHRSSAIRDEAEFVFIIGPGAKGRCEKRLRDYFGPNVEILYLVDLEQRYGPLEVRSLSVPSGATETEAALSDAPAIG